MAGKHHPAQRDARSRRSLLVVAVIVVVGVVGGAGTWLLSRDKPAGEARVKTRTLASTSCAGPSVTVTAQVAPNLAAAVNQIAAQWTATNPEIDGKCVQVELSADGVDQQEAGLAATTPAGTAVWIPDSSTWVQRLVSDRRALAASQLGITVHPSIASSPLVAVAAPDQAAKLTARLADESFDPLAGALIPEPIHNAEGVLDLLSEAPAAASGTLTAAQATTARLLSVSKAALATPGNGFDQLAGGAAGDLTFVASEQAVVAANQQHGQVVAVAVYPTRPTLGLDFPVVRLTRAGDDPALAPAATAFEAALRTPAAKAQFSAVGLRSADGTPVPKLGPAAGISPDLVPPATAPTSAQTLNVVRSWNAAVADSNTLAVIDLSGSMADPAGNGQSKVAVATDAAVRATSFFPDTSALGLWVFSNNQGGNQPWLQLVPLGPLSDQVGGGSRRQALLAADRSMPGRVHGGTALYDTALAAYQQVKADFDPSKSNAVVLMTDGRNEDTSSTRTLAQLLGELKAATDPAKPIKIITIGIGSGADAAALTQISQATGGKYYAVHEAADIAGVFLDAISLRR